MSEAQPTGDNWKSKIGAAAAATGGLLGSSYLHMTIILIGFGLLVSSVVMMTKFAGDKDNWTALKPQLMSIVTTSVFGGLALLAGAFIYFKGNPANTVTYSILLSSLAIALSVAAVSVSVITR